ncbi:hypothetical protein Peur_056706 [Populus x canadensis]
MEIKNEKFTFLLEYHKDDYSTTNIQSSSEYTWRQHHIWWIPLIEIYVPIM